LLDSAPEQALLDALLVFRSTYATRLDLMPRDSTVYYGNAVAEIDAYPTDDRPQGFLTALWEDDQDRYQDDPVGLAVQIHRHHRGDRREDDDLIVWHTHILELP
jgi:hypothetical protein